MNDTTDVSNEVLGAKMTALDRHVTTEFNALRELLKSQREGDQLAIKTALDASQELAARHNDLIRQGERKDATYATRVDLSRVETAVARLQIGGFLIAIGIVANLVKLWFT